MRRLPVFLLLALWFSSNPALSGDLEIHHIDVGQGDCTLIIGPDETSILIDAGNTGKGNWEVVPYLGDRGITSLDYVVATHLHSDHIGGLDEAINSGIDVKKAVFDHGGEKSTIAFRDYTEAADSTEAGSRKRILPGTILQLGDGATATCVVSGGRLFGGCSIQVKNENDKSVGFLVEYGGFDYLITGDLGGGGESQENVEIFVGAIVGNVDVLRVNHHGSSSSTCEKFLQQIIPEVAIISVGSNTYDHPTADVLTLLSNVAIYKTGEGVRVGGIVGGDIVVRTDGSSYTVEEVSLPLDACNEGTAQSIADSIFTQLLELSGVDAGEGRCMAITKKGTRCKRKAAAGSGYCWQHQR